MKTILVIDDEQAARENLKHLLSREFKVISAGSVLEGLEVAKTLKPDAILADLQMPVLDGIEFCKLSRLEETLKCTPILIVSGIADTVKRTECFLWGADDFIAKPYASGELIARLTSKLRWTRKEMAPALDDQDNLRCGNLSINEHRHEVLLGKKRVDLTNYEFKLLHRFLASPDSVLSREYLLDQVWTGSHVTVRTVDTHICTLRKKLAGFDHEFHAVHGRGYILRKIGNEN
jgi:two-component system OmpR family response regulator